MRLAPRKRPVQLVKVFEEVRALATDHDVRLLIVGDGPLRRRVERYAARRGLAACVEVTGRIPRSEVLGHLRASAIYVAPAPKESFGIAALEARCAGLPVVASSRSGVGEFVQDRVSGLLVANDLEMTVALADLVVDSEFRDRITAHNRRVAPPFDWTDALAATEALYRAAGLRAGVRTGARAGASAALPVVQQI
jgi:glycosyltransferase involved in cell wall biosynthesis